MLYVQMEHSSRNPDSHCVTFNKDAAEGGGEADIRPVALRVRPLDASGVYRGAGERGDRAVLSGRLPCMWPVSGLFREALDRVNSVQARWLRCNTAAHTRSVAPSVRWGA